MKVIIEKQDLDKAIQQCKEYGWSTTRCVAAQAITRCTGIKVGGCASNSAYEEGDKRKITFDKFLTPVTFLFDVHFGTYLDPNEDFSDVEKLLPYELEATITE